MEADRLLKVGEVAELLGLVKGTVYHMVSRRQLECIRLSARCLRFQKSALMEFIAANRVAAREGHVQEADNRYQPGVSSHGGRRAARSNASAKDWARRAEFNPEERKEKNTS